MPDVGRGGDVLGETPQPPGHQDALTPGRAERVIPKCFRLRPDGCVKRDHMRRQTRARRHIQFGIQLPRTNNSCEPDALQRHSLKHKHTNGHRSRFLRVPCSRRLLHSGPDVVLQIKKDNRHSKNHKAFMSNTFFIFTSVTVNKTHWAS